MMHYGFGNFGGGIYMILFWVLLIVGVVYLISRSNINFQNSNQANNHRNYSPDNTNRSKSPEEIAKERYAKGEINKEEYNEILKEINR